jgi:MFS family permease
LSQPSEGSGPAYEPPEHGFRTFVIVWITQSISVFGSALTFFAINIWLTQTLYADPAQKKELAWALSAVGLAFAIPVVLGAPIAGAWADRHDRKRIMMIADFLSGLLSLVLVGLILANLLSLWGLLILVVLFSLVSAFHSAAFDTSYAMLVPEKQLPRANGMMMTIWSLSGIIAPMLAAAIIALPAIARQGKIGGDLGQFLASLPSGVPLTIAIDGATFFLASVTLIFLFIPSPKRADLEHQEGKPKQSLWADIKVGALYIWHRRPLLWLLGTFTVANFTSGPLGVFQPMMVKFNLAADWASKGYTMETSLALLATIGSVGGLLGGILISAWGGLKTRRVFGVLVPLIIAGAAQMVYGLSARLYLTAVMAFTVEGMTPILNAHSQTIWQTQTPHELQGRVFSVRRLIAQISWPLSTAMAGWLGGLFDPGYVLFVLGAFLTLFCIAQLFNPYMLKIEDKEYLEELASRQVSSSA